MLGFGPVSGAAISALLDNNWGPSEADLSIVLEGTANSGLGDLLADQSKVLILAAEIDLVSGDVLRVATERFVTRAGDTPANTEFQFGLRSNLTASTSAIGQDGFGGYTISFSKIEIDNDGGRYDDLPSEDSVNGQTITFYLIEKVPGIVADWSTRAICAVMQGERMFAGRQTLTIEVRDPGVELAAPVQTEVYAGTGGLDGDASLKDKRHPYGDGFCFNKTPTLVNSLRRLYQYSSTPDPSSDLVVRDGGAVLPLHADYATPALLDAAWEAGSIPPGSYGSCVATHHFQLVSAQVKQITVDFQGPNSTIADIIEYAALNSAGIAAGRIESAVFAAFNDLQGATAGVYLDSNNSTETCGQMFERLTQPVGAFCGMTLQNRFTIGRIDVPGQSAAGYYTLPGNIFSITPVPMPKGYDPPPKKRSVAYALNGAVQTDLYGAVTEETPELADIYGKPYRVASTDESADIVARFPLAGELPPRESPLAEEADALTEAERQQVFDEANLRAYQVVFKNLNFVHRLGQDINIKDVTPALRGAPRLGLGDGKFVVIVSVDENRADKSTTMTVVG